MDAKQVREWKAGYEAVNRITLEEAKNRTPYERWQLHKLFVERLARMGRLPKRHPDEKFYLRWMVVKERWSERHPGV